MSDKKSKNPTIEPLGDLALHIFDSENEIDLELPEHPPHIPTDILK